MPVPIAQIPTPAVALDGKGLVYAANDAIARSLGVAAQELIGTEFAGWADDPDAFREFLGRPGGRQQEFRFHARDGSRRAIAISIGPNDAGNGELLLGFDTTTLRECERRYQAIFEVASDW